MATTRRNTTLRNKHRAAIKKARPPCAICGTPIDWDARYPDPLSYVIDHKQPLNCGGTDTLPNLQAAHAACNRAKSDHTDGGPVLRRSGTLRRPGEGTPPGA